MLSAHIPTNDGSRRRTSAYRLNPKAINVFSGPPVAWFGSGRSSNAMVALEDITLAPVLWNEIGGPVGIYSRNQVERVSFSCERSMHDGTHKVKVIVTIYTIYRSRSGPAKRRALL